MRNPETRLTKIETQSGGLVTYFVQVPADALDRGDAHLEHATQEAIQTHHVLMG